MSPLSAITLDQVEKVLDDFVRPVLHAEGGNLAVERITREGTVSVLFIGRCAGCPGADLTLEFLVTPFLKTEIPDLKAVTRVNWHLPRDPSDEASSHARGEANEARSGSASAPPQSDDESETDTK